MPLSTTCSKALDSLLVGFDVAKPMIPTYIHLLISALFCIYTGAHASLSRPSSAAKPAKKRRKDSNGDDETQEDDDTDDEESIIQKMEGLEPSDAIMFPILSGLTLGGLYLLLKHFDAAMLNKVLNWYFSHAGFMFATAFVKDGFSVTKSFVFPEHYASCGSVWKADQDKRVFTELVAKATASAPPRIRQSPLPGILGAVCLPKRLQSGLWHIRGLVYQKVTLLARVRSLFDIKARFTVLDVMSIVVALFTAGYAAFVARPWWLINFLGFGFSYGALQLLSPTTFATGTLMLSLLFFYDIYFVFYTPLMVTVAQKLDLPIKLLFPRPPTPTEDPSLVALSMLGLGDIVVPGVMIALALRFDLYLHYLHRNSSIKARAASDQDSRPYYITATGGWGERFWTATGRSRRLYNSEASYPDAKSFQKTYFNAGMTGYVLGMLATLLAMQISNQPQPALLYLVPGVLTSIWLTAFGKGEIALMWNFSDGLDDEIEESDDGQTQKDGKDQEQENDNNQTSLLENLKQLVFGKQKQAKKSNAQAIKSKDRGNTVVAQDEAKKPKEKGRNLELVFITISIPQKKHRQTPASIHDPKLVADSAPFVGHLDNGFNSPNGDERKREGAFKKRRTR